MIKERHSDFIDLCKRHKVSKLYAFESSITGHFDPIKSDIDVVVDLDIKDPWNTVKHSFLFGTISRLFLTERLTY